MEEEINKMKLMILQNQKMIENLTERIEKLEAKNNKVIRYNNTRPLTPNELVGHNMDIMKLIVDKINNIKERRNIELTCKAYYLLCNRPNSYLPLIGYEAKNSPVSKWKEEGGFTFLIHNDEITIDIPETFYFNTLNSPSIKNVLKKYIPKMKRLYILKLFHQHLEFFDTLDCFRSIETIKFSRFALQTGAGRLFEKCQSLKPHTFIANNDHVSAYYIRLFSLTENAIIFPSTLKNIYYDCFSEDIMWLVKNMKNLEVRNFDNLVITKEIIDSMQFEEMGSTFLKFITFFKNVNYFASDFVSTNLEEALGRTLAKHNIGVNITIYFGNSTFSYRRYLDLFDNQEHVQIRESFLSSRNSRILAHPGIYLNIKNLIIFDWDFSRFYFPFTHIEVKTLSQDLSMMNSLTTLELTFNLIPDHSSFYQIFSALGNKLKNLRLYFCSKMESNHFNILFENCTGLRNLSLINLKLGEMSIDKITSKLNNLQGLEIEFQNCKNISTSIWDNLKLYDNNNNYKLKWPKLQFLHIFCNLRSVDEFIVFERMRNETPRKSGKFFLKKFYRDDEIFIEIIIQKNVSHYDVFENIFTKR